MRTCLEVDSDWNEIIPIQSLAWPSPNTHIANIARWEFLAVATSIILANDNLQFWEVRRKFLILA